MTAHVGSARLAVPEPLVGKISSVAIEIGAGDAEREAVTVGACWYHRGSPLAGGKRI